MSTPEAGWYPDPETPGQARYWDGATWTDHLHPLEAVESPPPPPPTAGAQPTVEALTGPAAHAAAPAAAHPRATGALLVIVAAIVVVGAGVVFAFSSMVSDTMPDLPPPAPAADSPASADDALAGRSAAGPRHVDPDGLDRAGCEHVDPGDGSDVSHIDLTTAPLPSELYDVPLPAWGQHTAQVLPVIAEIPTSPLDVRVLLHNLEHGGIAVWLDPAAVSLADRDAAEEWLVGLLAGGFTSDLGANVYGSFTPEDLEVAPMSLRAWGVAVDCPAWDAAAADLFVATHYGTRGDAPEGSFGPYPEDGPLLGP